MAQRTIRTLLRTTECLERGIGRHFDADDLSYPRSSTVRRRKGSSGSPAADRVSGAFAGPEPRHGCGGRPPDRLREGSRGGHSGEIGRSGMREARERGRDAPMARPAWRGRPRAPPSRVGPTGEYRLSKKADVAGDRENCPGSDPETDDEDGPSGLVSRMWIRRAQGARPIQTFGLTARPCVVIR